MATSGFLAGPATLALVPRPVGHQSIVEEVTQIPVLAEGPRSKILQVVDVKVSGQVAVGEIRWQQQKILLLADLVCFLLMAGLGVLLEIGILLGLETRADVDEMSIEDRRAHAGTDVPPLRVMPLQEDHVHDLPDQGAAEVLTFIHLTRRSTSLAISLASSSVMPGSL